jgi:ribonuclease R
LAGAKTTSTPLLELVVQLKLGYQAHLVQVQTLDIQPPPSPEQTIEAGSGFRATVDRPLFAAARRPLPPPEAGEAKEPDPLQGVRFYGSYTAGNRAGIIVATGAEPMRVERGATVGGWAVDSADGRVAGVRKRQTLEANKLIEEFMIQANVAAAEELEKRRTPLVYRIHEPPSETKIAQLQEFLETVNLRWAKGNVVDPARFNRILEMAAETEHADVVNEVILRTQSQAIYHPANVGHFGLNLAKYAHFTSPIRRYADVIVHRALIRALKLGEDGLSDGEAGQLEATAEHISMCERRSMAAEREANDRYIASYLADRIGHEFDGRISGVTRFGLFVKLDETNADGLVPVSTLGAERFVHDEAAHALVGTSSGVRHQLGQRVRVALQEATPINGGLVFELLSEPLAPAPGWRKSIGAFTAPRPKSRRPDLRSAGKKGPRGKRKK